MAELSAQGRIDGRELAIQRRPRRRGSSGQGAGPQETSEQGGSGPGASDHAASDQAASAQAESGPAASGPEASGPGSSVQAASGQSETAQAESGPGGKTIFLVFAKLMPFLEERLILWVGVDVTASRLAELEKAELEEKLSRSRTMESMGRMAASVAHELNNILSALIGYPELLLKDESLPEAQKAQIAEIMDAGHRASAVVGDLLTLSRGVATAKGPVDLNQIADSAINGPMAARTLAAAARPVAVTASLAAKAAVKASPVHVKKVVSNLLQNAIEILSESGGHVEVSTSDLRLDKPSGDDAALAAGDYVCLEVADDGPGIAEADLPHIFEPFYTKKPGSGRGLGLALVDLTVREHGGASSVLTSPRGTTFRVLLPAMTKAEKPGRPIKHPELKGSGQRILIVDDVDIQRKLAQRMLKTLGYETLAVSSGEEAVVYLKEHDVDLIILDMIMDPGINGRQTYEEILSFKPGQKAIIASGLAENAEVARAQALGASHFVSKPYTLADIAGAVHKALHPDGPEAAA
jgi:signal transduction histidine kinase/ActR/RegA family two-component response regulator